MGEMVMCKALLNLILPYSIHVFVYSIFFFFLMYTNIHVCSVILGIQNRKGFLTLSCRHSISLSDMINCFSGCLYPSKKLYLISREKKLIDCIFQLSFISISFKKEQPSKDSLFPAYFSTEIKDVKTFGRSFLFQSSSKGAGFSILRSLCVGFVPTSCPPHLKRNKVKGQAVRHPMVSIKTTEPHSLGIHVTFIAHNKRVFPLYFQKLRAKGGSCHLVLYTSCKSLLIFVTHIIHQNWSEYCMNYIVVLFQKYYSCYIKQMMCVGNQLIFSHLNDYTC